MRCLGISSRKLPSDRHSVNKFYKSCYSNNNNESGTYPMRCDDLGDMRNEHHGEGEA